jgi:transcriptional repressor NF-X1
MRLFAADKEQKRFNFKPMKPHQRAFIHGLAEDFGFDTESMDPEPYRHVAVFKTPRFVASPLKTLAQCVRIQNTRLTDANAKAAETQKQVSAARSTPLNGFYIHGARFGLTEDDLRAAITSVLTDPTLTILISFLPHDEIALRASHHRLTPKELETHLRTLKPSLTTTLLLTNRLAESIQLCAFDPVSAVPNVLRQESDVASGASGWSQVAAKGAAPPKFVPVQEAVGKKTVYTVLGSRLAEAKKKRKEEEEMERRAKEGEVVDDWEVAAERDDA